uniref:Uncharacterized protein n=1 Tax=Leersia perrieri TaxID=77586 RepID=A0A0D9VF52_9ORYZ
MKICSVMAQAATSFDNTPTATLAIVTKATPSPAPAFTTVVDTPSAKKGKQVQDSPAAIEPTTGSDSERIVSEEIIGWRYGPNPDQVVLMDRVEDQKNMTRLNQLISESSGLVQPVSSRLHILKLITTDIASPDPALVEVKKQAEEQILKLQAELTLLQGKNEELIEEKKSAEEKLPHAVVLNVKSHEQANYYKDKLETLLKKHEELKAKSAKELSAMKTKHNEEFLKMKTELDRARKVNTEFCQAAEPILDNLHAATAGTNTSSFETVIDLLQSAPSRLKKIILESASVACGQTLAVIRSLYPKLDLTPITLGYADGTTTEKALELLDEVDGMAQIMAKDALYPEEENDDE